MSTKLLLPLMLVSFFCLAPRAWSQGQNQQEAQLPEGNGKEIVQVACAVCHSLNQVTNAGHIREDWDTVLHQMVNVGAPVPPDKFNTVLDYLAKNFPAKPLPPGVTVPGPADVSIKEWVVPTPGSRPHDPMFAPDGTAWYSGHMANILGHFDPKTGEIKLATSPTPKSNPYGMVISSKGVPIFCEFGSNKIASIDPDTLEIHEWILPHEDSRPRRIAITPDDAVWYSDYSRGYLGRLDTKAGKVTGEWSSPSGPKSQPYGITAIGNIIWYVESNSQPNMLVRFDPKTDKFQSWPIPGGGGVVRNMVHTPDGNLWLTESGVNRLAFVEVKKGQKVSLNR